MKKTRLEAFSDGVFAIAITLLILNVKLPDVSYDNLPDSLIALLPTVGVYVMTFLLIGMYWVFHHYTFTFIAEVDGVLLWINIIFLLFVSFLPFPTSMLGKYPFHTLPVVIYCSNLILVNLMGFLCVLYLRSNKPLTTGVFSPTSFRKQLFLYIWVNGSYFICLVLAFYVPKFSVYILLTQAIALMIRSAVFMGIGKRGYVFAKEHS